jgi:high-affinity Fe2+/Pb2+ permease
MGAFIFTNKNILNSNLLNVYEEQAGVTSLADEYAKSDVGFVMMLIQRFTSGIGIFYLVFVVLLTALYILRNTVGLILVKLFSAIFKLICCCCQKSEATLEKEEQQKKDLAKAQGLDVHS